MGFKQHDKGMHQQNWSFFMSFNPANFDAETQKDQKTWDFCTGWGPPDMVSGL